MTSRRSFIIHLFVIWFSVVLLAIITTVIKANQEAALERVADQELQQERMQEALDGIQENREALERIAKRLEQLESRTTVHQPQVFQPLDIPLEAELQAHTYDLCMEHGVSFEIMLAIMEHESGFRSDAVGYNTNGTTDHGLCQINSCNRDWLLEENGLDITNPWDNIEAAIIILSGYLEKYTLGEALAAYAAGESGMMAGGGKWFAKEIMKSTV